MVVVEKKSDEKTALVPKVQGTELVATAQEQHKIPNPKNNRRLWLWGLIGLAILAIAGFAYSQYWLDRPQVVEVEIASFAPVTRLLAVNGRIASIHSVDVRPLVSGILETLSVAEGDHIEEGQVIGVVNSESQNAIVRQSMASLDASLVAQQQATEAYDRSVKLGSNVARTVLETNAHAVQSAKQEVARQTALFDQARIALLNHTILAPFTGKILVLNVEAGQVVDLGTVLLTLANLDGLVVETDVDEAYARQIALGQNTVLQLTGETGTLAGHVSFVSTQVDLATGGLAVRITFDKPIKAPVGMTVATNIIVEQLPEALTLPRSAIVTGESGAGFFVVRDGKAQHRPVTVIEWPAARLVVIDGLTKGDVVIVDAAGLVDGALVEVVKP